MRYLLIFLFACFFGSLLVDPAVLAQQMTPVPDNNLTTTTVPDNRYGEGGTREIMSDGKFRLIEEVWKDKAQQVKEVHRNVWHGSDNPYESWQFGGDNAAPIARFGTKLKDGTSDESLREFGESYTIPGSGDWSSRTTSSSVTMTREAIKEKIEEIEKQFARDGTLPKQLEQPKLEKEVETKVEQPVLTKNEVFTKPGAIDPCLIGTWECTSFKQSGSALPDGGSGFRVTFKSDGTESIDYSKMVPFTAKNDPGEKVFYAGKASVKISAKDGEAQMEDGQNHFAGVTLTMESKARATPLVTKFPGLGPGGLGSAPDKSSYTCSGDSLEYQGSVSKDRKANCTVKLTRVKP